MMDKNVFVKGIILSILLVLPGTWADPVIPTDSSKLDSWFSDIIKPVEPRKSSLDQNLVTAEASPVLIKVRQDGSGQFKTVQEAVNSVKSDNKVRTIIDIGPGEYTERIKIERFKPYITFLGDPAKKPTLQSDGTAAKFGTVDSASVIIEAEYFVASNIIFKNSAPRPTLETKGGQAVALRIAGEKATFYNCRFLGFQDTLCDSDGKHLYKDCYIEGTVDFIFGSGQSIYLRCEIHVIDGDNMAMITAHARDNEQDPGGYVFIHGNITGKGKVAVLGRSWMPAPRVLFTYTDMSEAVAPEGWSDNRKPETQKTVFFRELKNTGPGSDRAKRVSFFKELAPDEVKTYLTLDWIEGPKWILPPPTATGAAAAAPGAAPGAAPAGAAPAGGAKPKR